MMVSICLGGTPRPAGSAEGRWCRKTPQQRSLQLFSTWKTHSVSSYWDFLYLEVWKLDFLLSPDMKRTPSQKIQKKRSQRGMLGWPDRSSMKLCGQSFRLCKHCPRWCWKKWPWNDATVHVGIPMAYGIPPKKNPEGVLIPTTCLEGSIGKK